MAQIYEGSRVIAGSRSHSRLVVNDLGPAPAGQWKIDDNAPGLFEYHYGGWTLPGTKVVIPKGSLVAVAGMQKDYRTNSEKAALNFAGPTKLGEAVTDPARRPIGVAAYNYYRRFNADGSIAHDLSEGDDFQPGIITNAYIEVPYLPNPADVYSDPTAELTDPVTQMKFRWGCVTLTVEDFEAGNVIRPGDYVTAGPFGKFVKTADKAQAVGIVLEVLTELPPYGWLQWVQEGEETDLLRRDAEPFVPAGINSPYGYDPKYNFPADRYELTPAALHRGLAIKQRETTVTTDDTGEATFRVDPIFGADPASFKVEGATVTYTGGDTATLQGAPETTYVVRYEIPADTSGVPTTWDYLGAAGAVHIKLLF